MIDEYEFRKMVKDHLKEDHTSEEWKQLFGTMVLEAMEYYKIESFFEQQIEARIDEEGLLQMCSEAIRDYNEMKNTPKKHEPLSPEMQKIKEQMFKDLRDQGYTDFAAMELD